MDLTWLSQAPYRAFAAMDKECPGALLVIGDPTLGIHRKRIAELAIKHRLPTSGTVREWAELGLLIAYGANFIDAFRHAATYVDKILKGPKPARPPRGAAHQVRAGHQPQDRQGARADDPAVAAAAGG